jgi:hypothetical protein
MMMGGLPGGQSTAMSFVSGTIRWPRLIPCVGRNQVENEAIRVVSGLQIQ